MPKSLHGKSLELYTDRQLVSDLNLAAEFLDETVREVMRRRSTKLHNLARARIHRLMETTLPRHYLDV